MTPDDYTEMLDAQGGVCAACGCGPTGRGREKILVVDHCHDAGTVRGLLCGNCNSALGLMHENPQYLKGLLRYARERC